MNEYYSKHRHLIYLWLFLLVIAGVSGSKILSARNKKEAKKTEATQNLESNTTTPSGIATETKIDEQKKEDAKKLNIVVEDIVVEDKKTNNTANVESATTTNEIKQNDAAPPEPPPITEAIMYIGDEKTILPIGNKTTLYEAMAKLQKESKLTFSGREYSGLGYFVDEINGVKNDMKEGYYHIYYVNGESAKVGISNYIIKPNDIITWKYEKSIF